MDYEDLLKAIVDFARAAEDISALVLFGSRATDQADQYSDADLIVIASDPQRYQKSEDWITRIGSHWMSFHEDTFGGGKERRVLFDNALDVDFLFFTREEFEHMLQGTQIAALQSGFVILYDACGLVDLLKILPVVYHPSSLPTITKYNNLIADFYFHAIWGAKKLLRGELWSAKSCVDCYMKQRLLTMLEWQARAVNGPDYQTGFAGRYVDTWADPSALKDLGQAFAHYNQKDVPNALLHSINIFAALAKDSGERLGFPYPVEMEKKTKQWVKTALAIEET